MRNNLWLVFKKELTDLFRDKKTVLVSILIPLIMFPLIYGLMGKSISKTTNEMKKNFKIAIKDTSNSSLSKFIKSDKDIQIIDSSNANEDVKDGKILLAIEIPNDFENILSKDSNSKVNIVYDNSSQQSQMALNIVNKLIEDYSKEIVAERLSKKGIDKNILNPISIQTQTTEKKEESGTSKMMLAMMLPMFILIYAVSGPMASAIDLGAGEKERGTLEPLLTTSINRTSLLWGKLFAITVMGFLTTTCTIVGLVISLKRNPQIFGGGNGNVSLAIDVKTLLFIGLIALLTTMAFGALELSISVYARSFKEAQTYLSPLSIIALVPAFLTYIMDVKTIKAVYFHIPLTNITCILKEFIYGIYNPMHIVTVLVWTIVYIILSILLARYMFSKEEVVFRA